MTSFFHWTSCSLVLVLLLLPVRTSFDSKAKSKLVQTGKNGKLIYLPDKEGNTLPDFSNCGFKGGGVALPQVAVKRVVSEGDGDDGARIQQAIDGVAALPPDRNGIRGAVLLKKGRYEISGALQLAQSGVVLRGEGQGEDGTLLVATGESKRALIKVGGSGEPREIAGTRRQMTDTYVPVGARSFSLNDVSGLEVGDSVIVHRPSTQDWIHYLGMDQIPPRRDGQKITQWEPGSKDLRFDRIITGIAGNRITIDAPLTNAFDQKYGGGSIYKYDFPGRILMVGVENLRGVSEFKGPEDEMHSWNFIVMDAVSNAWVRKITAVHFVHSAVDVEDWGKWITVEDSNCLDPISRITGSRRYPFLLSGQLTLVQRCYARNGRHDFVNGSGVAGPNVFLDCSSEQAHADSGPHHRWATGTLFDNVKVQGNAINIRNRGNLGTGHGWAGANMVLWNCAADSIISERPPTAQNWAIGCQTPKRSGDGYWESIGQPVSPRSLYLKQLEDRLGRVAVVNISSKSP